MYDLFYKTFFNKKVIFVFKVIFFLIICVIIGKNALLHGIKPYYSYQDYDIRNDISSNAVEVCDLSNKVQQGFYAKGNILSKINVYFTGNIKENTSFIVEIKKLSGKSIYQKSFSFNDIVVESWNPIDISVFNLNKGEEYYILLSSNDSTAGLYLDIDSVKDQALFTNCVVNENQTEKTAVIGLQFTHQYIALADFMLFVVRLLFIVVYVLLLCFAIFNWKKLYQPFQEGMMKQGILYAIYFLILLIFLFNPMDNLRTEVLTFTREIGAGLTFNYDINRTISNFKNWFLFFAIFFVLYLTVANYWLKLEKTDEQIQITNYLNSIIVLADLNLILRCATYFYDESVSNNVFYYSTYLLALIIISLILYLVLRLDKQIYSEVFLRLLLCGYVVSFPIATIITKGQELSKFLIGIQTLVTLLLLVVSKVENKWIKKIDELKIFTEISSVLLCLFSFIIFFYIKFINILRKLYQRFQKNVTKQSILYAIYFSISFLFQFNLMYRTDIFKEVINKINTNTAMKDLIQELIFNYNFNEVINNFTKLFLYFIILFVICLVVVNYCFKLKKTDEQIRIIKYLDNIILLADLNLVFRCISYFYDESVSNNNFYYSTHLLALIIISLILYLVLQLDKQVCSKTFLRLLICGYAIGFPIAIISAKEWESGKLLICTQGIVILFLIFISKIEGKWIQKVDKLKVFKTGCMVFCLFPFMTSFYIEFINILNQHSLYISYPRKYYTMCVLIMFIFWCIFTIFVYKKQWKLQNWKTWTYIWIIFGVSCLHAQIPLMSTYNVDLFESANYSVPISDFLNFGNIPIIEQVGHHMMANVWEGLIYALLNRDYTGAIFSPYGSYYISIVAVLFYCLIKHIWDEDCALWVTITFPSLTLWSYFGYGMLMCLAVISYVKNNTYQRAFLIWLAFVWIALYRIDLGYSFGIACIVALFIYVITKKNFKAAKQLIISLCLIGIIGIAIWCGLCVLKNINPITRLIEFLKVFSAKINWANSGIGNNKLTIYSWAYLFIPLTADVSLLYVIFSKKFKEKVDMKIWILLIILGISYFVNFPRALVRHNVGELGNVGIIVMWTVYIYISLLIACLFNKKALFLVVYTFFILCNAFLTFNQSIFSEISISDSSSIKVGEYTQTWGKLSDDENETQTYWEKLNTNKETVNRVNWSKSLEEVINSYRYVTEILLNDNDTFLGFISNSFIYSALNRDNPVYVAQSPTMMSGELSQKYFISEIESNMENIPIAFMPNSFGKEGSSIDWILHNCKYYKVAEFIYENYRPLCESAYFSIWCLNDRYDEMSAKLKATDIQIDGLTQLLSYENFETNNCNVLNDKDKQVVILESTGQDPQLKLGEIQNIIDFTSYQGELNINLIINYETSIDGTMELFYTTDKDENYTANKCVKSQITKEGIAEFAIPITEFTKLRIDIPEKSKVVIKSMTFSIVSLIDWGYDEKIHDYSLNQLPLIWAELDEKKAINNNVVSKANRFGNIYVFDSSDLLNQENGNYLLLKTTYGGTDIGNLSEADDEYISAVVKIGNYENESFKELYRYKITLKEGEHNYLIRLSSDYYWHLGKVNAASIECESKISNTEIKILEGD